MLEKIRTSKTRSFYLVLLTMGLGLLIGFQNCGGNQQTMTPTDLTDSSSSVRKLAATTTLSSGNALSIGESSILFDATGLRCGNNEIFLDSNVVPLSFTGATPGTAWVTMNAIDFSVNNYQISGTLSKGQFSGLQVNCATNLKSPLNPSPSAFAGAQWLMSFFKINQVQIAGVIHNEFYGGGFTQNGTFPDGKNCTHPLSDGTAPCLYGNLSMALSNNGGVTYTSTNVPTQIAKPAFGFSAGYQIPNGLPSRYGTTVGYFVNSNIVLGADGFYYMIIQEYMPSAKNQICTARTKSLTDGSPWLAWNGTGYVTNLSTGADCVATNSEVAPFYLGYNTYFKAYIMVGTLASPSSTQNFAYTLSSDFIHWTSPVDLGVTPSWKLPVPAVGQPPGPDWGRYNYPTLMDTNFMMQVNDLNSSSGAVTGQNPQLLFIEQQGNDKHGSRIRSLQLHFSNKPQASPNITSSGQGCENFQCVWAQGSGFSAKCQVQIYSIDGTQTRVLQNVICTDNAVNFSIPDDYAAAYDTIYYTITNQDGVWTPLQKQIIRPPTPMVLTQGLGCADNRCVWVMGNQFYQHFHVAIYDPLGKGFLENVQSTSGAAIFGKSSYVTFRIPDDLYDRGYKNIAYVIVDDWGARQTWSEMNFINIK